MTYKKYPISHIFLSLRSKHKHISARRSGKNRVSETSKQQINCLKTLHFLWYKFQGKSKKNKNQDVKAEILEFFSFPPFSSLSLSLCLSLCFNSVSVSVSKFGFPNSITPFSLLFSSSHLISLCSGLCLSQSLFPPSKALVQILCIHLLGYYENHHH